VRHTRILIILLSFLAAGCANQIASTQFQREVPQTKAVKQSFVVHGGQDLLTSPQLHLTLARVETSENEILQITTYSEEFTPYSGWREFYEVPAGIVCLPFAVGYKIIDFVALGFIPDEQSNGFVSWSFAAMNPFMNVESKERAVQE